MKKILRKFATCCPTFLSRRMEWFLSDSAENHIRMTKARENRFSSYTQLKKHQKRVKIYVTTFFLSLLFLLIGLVMGPILMPAKIESELYLPNGKGDIVIGNISKNQATIIFKTLDSANNNDPLATRAIVEVFDDSNFSKLVRRTTEDDYAVTHIVPIDSLQENHIYYARITARDASVPSHTKTISSLGDNGEPIKFYTTGELIPTCAPVKDLQASNENVINNAISTDEAQQDPNQAKNQALAISSVMNENYLQPKNKVQTIISWSTNKPAKTVLIYSEGNSKEKIEVIISEQLRTRHAAVLTTLKAGTTYYFSTKSIDESGAVVVSDEYSLRTPKPQSTIIEKVKASFKSIFHQIKPL